MKKILLAGGVLLSMFSIAQDNGGIVSPCHTVQMQNAFFEAHPELREEAEHMHESILKEARIRRGQGYAEDGDPYIIPVVFHVIHENGEENISFEQIQNAVEAMTADFNANNVFISSVNDNFVDLIGDIGVEFRLAKRDPEGNCTNGVVRTFNFLTNSGGENLKEISPIWDRSSYLNIWVCKTIASGAAGYTYYPSTLAGDFGETNDGIVVRHDYVGGIGTSSLDRAFVLAHEVGHWINLPHLWGSTNEPNVPGNCDTDDGIADTPNTIGWTNCVTNGESCGSPDNVENFMEYSFCSKMFTEGQKNVMLASLNSTIAERSSLWTEENLVETGVLLDDELCDADFSSSVQTICVGNSVDFQDLSFSNVSSRTWIFEGGTPPVSFEATPQVIYNEPGLYTVSLAASDTLGNELTEVKEAYIQVLDTGLIQLPFSEGFESGDSFEELEGDYFFTENLYGPDLWEVSSETGATGNGSAVFRATQAESVVEKSAFVSETFQLSEVGENPVLTFKYAGGRSSASSNGELWVFISKNCGDFWSLRKKFDDGEVYTNPGVFPDGYVPEEGDWLTYEIDNITSVFQNEEFRLRFEYKGQNGGTVYVDDINLIDGATLNTVFSSEQDLIFGMFPNPTTGMVTLELGSDYPNVEDILLRDLSGRIVRIFRNERINGSEAILNISDIASGVYLLEVRSENGSSAKKLIVE